MMRKFYLVSGLVALALTSAGCLLRPSTIKPNKTVSVNLTAEKKSTTIRVGHQNLVALTLPPAEPGQSWQISFHDTRFLKQVTEIKPAATAGEGGTVSFVALNVTPRTKLLFHLVPISGDRESKPIDQQELVLSIQ